MIIPEHLIWSGMPEEDKKNQAKLVVESRKKMKAAPTYDKEDQAKARAFEAFRANPEFMPPTVWKEPKDMGRKYALVEFERRETAYNAGYTEKVDAQAIINMNSGRKNVDTIDEV